MKGIDLYRVLLGGLAAGLIIVVGEYLLNGVVLGDQFVAQREAIGLGDPTAGELEIGAIITLTYGIVLTWIYAAIRPRFGPGPRTAIIAGLTFWSIAYLLFLVSLWANGFVIFYFAGVSIIWGLFESSMAALVGAWIYKEDE